VRGKKVAFAAVIGGLALTGAVLAAVPAHASAQYQICAQSGSGYALNAWGGYSNGNPVDMYSCNDTNNNDFYLLDTTECGGGHVTYIAKTNTGCPFTNPALDDSLEGQGIFQIAGSGTTCVDSNTTNGFAYIVTSCAVSGVAYVADTNADSCDYPVSELVNVYWSNSDDEAVYLQSGGSIGAQAGLTASAPVSCWGGSGI
jgi:hypothetical protein